MIFDTRKVWRCQRGNSRPWFEEGDVYVVRELFLYLRKVWRCQRGNQTIQQSKKKEEKTNNNDNCVTKLGAPYFISTFLWSSFRSIFCFLCFTHYCWSFLLFSLTVVLSDYPFDIFKLFSNIEIVLAPHILITSETNLDLFWGRS
jgi:hypothetical protein